jgi:hypothetical protein
MTRNTGWLDTEMCKTCGGWCCQMAPPVILPCDFKVQINSLAVINALVYGNMVVDYWMPGMKGKPGYFLRYRTTRDPIDSMKRGGWGGQCVLWSKDKGCALGFNSRPWECRQLKPTQPGGPCYTPIFGEADPRIKTSYMAMRAWHRYIDILITGLRFAEDLIIQQRRRACS